MYVITIAGKKEEGAYSVQLSDGSKVLQIFEDTDDAERYAGLLEAEGLPRLEVTEIDDQQAIQACESFGYNYVIITPNDFVIPPTVKHDFI
jgi:hypothetical protein